MTVLALFVIAGCREKVAPGVKELKREQVTGITVESVVPSMTDEYYETSGTVKAKTVSMISAKLMGSITSVKVNEGDRVRAGQLLLTIDDSDVAQKLTGANEGYAEARKALEAADENRKLRDITYQRYKKLYDEKAMSRQELDQLETQKKVAELDYERAQAAVRRVEAGLNEAKVYHGYSSVKSPVSGIVTEKKAEVGSMAVPGMPLITVEDDSALRIELNADEKISALLKAGMTARVFIDSLGREVRGSVSEVVRSVDPMSRTALVKIAVRADGLRPGMYARVGIPVGKKEMMLVPKNVVVEKGQLTGVYTVDPANVIKYRLIRLGKTYDNKVEILSGINPNERIIVSGVEKAVDGGIAASQK